MLGTLPSRTLRLAIPAALLFVLGAAAGCAIQDIGGEPTEKQDDEARKKHYEESAQTYYEHGEYRRAVDQWKKVLELAPGDQKAMWGLAKSHAMVGTPQSLREAEVIYLKIIDLDWSHPTRGNIKFEVERDLAQVYVDLAEWFQKGIHADEEQLSEGKADKAAVQAHMQRSIASRNELLQKAIPLYEDVLQKSENNPYALAGLAEAHLLVGQDMKGVEYGLRYVSLSEESQRNWKAELDGFTKMNGDATTQQREYFAKKIRGAREKELKMRLLIASVLMRNGRASEAIVQYDAVIAKDAARPAAYVERAQAYAKGGNYRKAILDLEKYLQITDPVLQREARISAAELLDTYRIAAATAAVPPPAPAPGPTSRPR